MTIEEMKAKGYMRYAAYIQKTIATKEVEVWAKKKNDVFDILLEATKDLSNMEFENLRSTEAVYLGLCEKEIESIAEAQSTVTRHNEDFYKSEEE